MSLYRMLKVANKIAFDFSADYDEYNPEDVEKAWQEVLDYVNNYRDYLSSWRDKQKRALQKLEKAYDDALETRRAGVGNIEVLENKLNKALTSYRNKQRIFETDLPQVNQTMKEYSHINLSNIKGTMTQGEIHDAFNCIANVISRMHDIQNNVDRFQEYTDFQAMKDLGFTLRTSRSKQSSNLSIVKLFVSAAKKRLRMKDFTNALDNATRNVFVDLVDADGTIIAFSSAIAVAARDFEKFNVLPDFDGFGDTPQSFGDDPQQVHGMLTRLFNNLKGYVRGIVSKVKSLFTSSAKLLRSAESLEDNADYAAFMTNDLAEIVKVLHNIK